MELERRILRGATVEGYRVLLRAEADLLLPRDYPKIHAFYLALAEKCIAWATEVSGERVRQSYLKTESNVEKARFRTYRYSFRMRYPKSDEGHAVILCESQLSGLDGRNAYRRLSHVWYLSEETVLPHRQILRLYAYGKRGIGCGFRADGIYPEEGELVFFKNATEKTDFMEKRYAIGTDGKL